MAIDQAPLLVTVETAAEMLGIGRTRLYELLQTGEIRAVRIGRCRRVPLDELQQFVDLLVGETDE